MPNATKNVLLDDSRLVDYCTTFFGYGRWAAPVWFIGIEEAGDDTKVAQRLDEWNKRNRKDIEDAPSFYPLLHGNADWHGPAAIPQPTWIQLIRMLLIAQGKDDSLNHILDYQRRHLGAVNGDTCLLELLPLPCRSTADKDWGYGNSSNLSWLRSREKYQKQLAPKRAKLLASQIQQHRPGIVIFYGTSCLPTWSRIAGGWFGQAINKKLMTFKKEDTTFFITKHPTDPKLRPHTDDYFREIGHFFHKKCGNFFPSCEKDAKRGYSV